MPWSRPPRPVSRPISSAGTKPLAAMAPSTSRSVSSAPGAVTLCSTRPSCPTTSAAVTPRTRTNPLSNSVRSATRLSRRQSLGLGPPGAHALARVPGGPSPALAPLCDGSDVIERAAAGVSYPRSELLFDTQQLVVLGNAIRTRRRPGLDLARGGGHGQIGDRGVFRLARAMRDDRCPAGALGHLDGIECLSERTDLVELDQDDVGGPLANGTLQAPGIGHQQVIAHELHTVAQPGAQLRPPLPIILGQAILERDDRILVTPARPEVDQLVRREVAPFLGQVVRPVGVQLARGRVERQRHLIARLVASALD